MTIPEALNLSFIEDYYKKWKADPAALPRDWQFFFEGFDIAHDAARQAGDSGRMPPGEAIDEAACTPDRALRQSRVEALKHGYRDLGHLLACLDPLSDCPISHPLLDLSAFHLTPEDLNDLFYMRRKEGITAEPLADIIARLKETYCRSVGVEYMHIQDPEERNWIKFKMESTRNRPDLTDAERTHILKKLLRAGAFETFLNKKYTGQTRFSLEGAETLIPMLDALLLTASEGGVSECILGMAHRGRLNVLTNILLKSYEEIFREFINSYDPDTLSGSGDVKYHNGYLTDLLLATGEKIRVFMVNNPSHLESVDPVVEGVARARQDMIGPQGNAKVLPLLLHGDAAFAGQGVVPETLNLSHLEGYQTGGTIHVVINNQIGYTTLPENARSTRYSTDVVKMLMAPVFHVHGENPEAAVHVMRLACEYRMKFGKDVVIDLVCYRRFGHNEGDEPYFTQPRMYDRIRSRPPVPDIYRDQLLAQGLVTEAEVETIRRNISRCLEEDFETARTAPLRFPEPAYFENWSGYHGNFDPDTDTRFPAGRLRELAGILNTVPEGFTPHATVKRILSRRLDAVMSGTGIDWANAEALALASLLSGGFGIRFSGQDVGRGTFSQRHAVLTDRKTGDQWIPLKEAAGHLSGDIPVDIINSSLSEEAVMGFDYGYSTIRGDMLTIWEAQFGDFANNAQSLIDLYIASGESKWQRLSGLVLLLPHGWEGLGPEHSSARLERFLQLCAQDNMQVCDVTTPAQYFHLLRRQMLSDWRKPLILMTPKSLLRHPGAVSTLEELSAGRFQPVIADDPAIRNPERVIFCSGKIYYQLLERRDTLKARNIAIIRVEQLYPFPEAELRAAIAPYAGAAEFFWVQEAPENMGGWNFMESRLRRIIQGDIRYIGRKASPSPATGFANIYREEQAAIPDEAVGKLVESAPAAGSFS